MIARSRYLLQALASEVRGLQRAAYVLAIFAFASGLLALLREHTFAHVFGAGTTFDLYNAAFRIPDILFVIMGALVSVYVLIPDISKRNQTQQLDFVDTIITAFSILSIVTCAVAMLAAPLVLPPLFPKLVAEGMLSQLVLLTRIMLLQPVLLGFSNILAAITQCRHRYLLYASSQLLYNVGIIFGTIFLYPIFGAAGLALGVVLGAGLQVFSLLPSVVSDGFFHRLPAYRERGVVLMTAARSVPRALALSMSEIAENGLVLLAGMLAPGSISVFFYAYNMQSVPLSVIGASYSVAAFPGLASALARGERERFIEYVAAAAKYIVFWSLPATALIIVLRAHIVRVILGSGAFSWPATRLTAAAFALFAVSLTAQGLMLLILRAYYAAGRSFVPLLMSSLMAVTTILLGAVSIGAFHIPIVAGITKNILRVSDVAGGAVLMLAFAFTLSSIAGTLALLIHFELRFRGFFRKVARSWLQSLGAACATAAGAYAMLDLTGPLTLSSTVLTIFLHGFSAGIAGIAAGGVAYWLMHNSEFVDIWTTMRRRIPNLRKQASVLPPDIVAATEEHTGI